ncbi:bifunctional glutamate N-acetyltransferase/amino-acid acetyltransferase ArgJ [Desulfuribacillus alkaliarsenatis]|uniref:Arginine biosynthesis bifunctional protein ArgJ n=1 Tax=Desulfuribacillus alkaliarsenatis TaxID=766136 RepID=A0A1E5G3Z8_9FIRM|nr:bifunctional glutamate N-acetyltransferase/amino-acid acetyltransferase ArgJ [Desulfuribacillus alkaliarsenatis]OEF97811.1 bifunctional ornithine acetyltransferase/N-acetylglutamate synthase [Desulfuribacillus alkaliarsenatis]
MDFKIVDGGTITTPKGFKAQGVYAGIKRKRNDLGILYSTNPANAAGVYTLNVVQAAPLKLTKESILKSKQLQALVVNSGNANACTGVEGDKNARKMQELVATGLDIPNELVGVASTGVIGQQLPMDCVEKGIEMALADLSENGGPAFSESILTTDLIEKNIAVQVEIAGNTVSIAGSAKGSGMIHPNMATMLGFITTDAGIEHEVLQKLLATATDQTFNMITVDGDTSTNDMVVVMANGQSGVNIDESHPEWNKFVSAFTHVSEYLAKAIARDGEGATKLIEVTVTNGASFEEAAMIAKSVIGSSLVKSAIFGADANWGRIVAAAGYSGAQFNPDKIDVYLMGTLIFQNGMGVDFDEEAVQARMQEELIPIEINLHQGEAQARAWGCDLTYDYVRINASYRT